MPLKRLPHLDSLDAIIRAGQIDSIGLSDLKDGPEGLRVLETWRKGVEKLLTDYDRRWIALCKDDVNELTEWASRMRLVRGRLDEIDRHLAVKGSRLFNWDAVLPAMGLVNAFRVAIEQTINHSEQDAA
jgi:hypothetical protein